MVQACWRANKPTLSEQMTVTKWLIKHRRFVYPLQHRLQSDTCTLDAYWSLAHFSHISHFWQIALSQRKGRLAFILSHSDSACVGTKSPSSSSRKSFVMDGWVNRVDLIHILIEALPLWTFGFSLFSRLSPMVLVSFLINSSFVCCVHIYKDVHACISRYTHELRHCLAH